jgi:phosphomannomutase
MPGKLTCFKAYDIRGKLGSELNEDIAYRIGRAYGEYLKPKAMVLGGDVRLTSEPLKLALAKGLQDSGTDVIDIGLTGTEEIYFATSQLNVDGGIEITASHNPMDYNGMKLVREGSRPISGDSGLNDIQRLAENNIFPEVNSQDRGSYIKASILDSYIKKILTYINFSRIDKPLKIVFNSGNGAAGHVIDALDWNLKKIMYQWILLRYTIMLMVIFLMVFRILYCPSAVRIQRMQSSNITLIWELLLMVISIDVSFLMTMGPLSKGIIL